MSVDHPVKSHRSMMIHDGSLSNDITITEAQRTNAGLIDPAHSSEIHSVDSRSNQTMTATTLEVAAANGPVRVPGTYPPAWVPDQEADSCMACESQFTLIRRRHHCRSCGRLFCGDCCKLKAKLLYMDNREARVCNNCFDIIEYTFSQGSTNSARIRLHNDGIQVNSQLPIASNDPLVVASSGQSRESGPSGTVIARIQGVLKATTGSSEVATSNNSCNTSSASSDQQSSKQVIFADGIRPGTDLCEPSLVASSSTTSKTHSSRSIQNLLTRQLRSGSQPTTSSDSSKKSKSRGLCTYRNITVCDEQGYLPPIVISKEAPIMNPISPEVSNDGSDDMSVTNTLTKILLSHLKSSKKTIEASMESRSCPLNNVVKFTEIADLVGLDGMVTFLLLKDFELKVKIIKKTCCLYKQKEDCSINSPLLEDEQSNDDDTRCVSLHDETQGQLDVGPSSPDIYDSPDFWCFLSNGLSKLGQDEVLIVVDKDKDDFCVPRDVFKIYLTLHELSLRRQTLENLGNLLFQDGLFGSRDTAGLLLVRPTEHVCLKNLILPDSNPNFLIALLLQRWEVPWSKVFPMRLLLRIGYKLNVYPYSVVSFKCRDPVYYEIGHTIISILGDFRNFRYSLTHVEGLTVIINKARREVSIRISQSSYAQFNKVLDSANNEHVLAWSSHPSPEADGHLVCVQNEDGNYETIEFVKNLHARKREKNVECKIGASFVVFSGALKVGQTGQPAKISIVEDGLLIQIQSSTMLALRNAIHYMHRFDIDCGCHDDPINRVEVNWTAE